MKRNFYVSLTSHESLRKKTSAGQSLVDHVNPVSVVRSGLARQLTFGRAPAEMSEVVVPSCSRMKENNEKKRGENRNNLRADGFFIWPKTLKQITLIS